MKKFALVPLFAIALVAGCQDQKVVKELPVEPSIPSFSADLAGESGFIASDESTVCVAYKADLEAAKAANEADKVATFTAIIEDACTN